VLGGGFGGGGGGGWGVGGVGCRVQGIGGGLTEVIRKHHSRTYFISPSAFELWIWGKCSGIGHPSIPSC
jgi:hypothetical protein